MPGATFIRASVETLAIAVKSQQFRWNTGCARERLHGHAAVRNFNHPAIAAVGSVVSAHHDNALTDHQCSRIHTVLVLAVPYSINRGAGVSERNRDLSTGCTEKLRLRKPESSFFDLQGRAFRREPQFLLVSTRNRHCWAEVGNLL